MVRIRRVLLYSCILQYVFDLLLNTVIAQTTSCGLKCKDCSVEGTCKVCEDEYIFSNTLQHCVSQCSSASYYYEPNQACNTICPSSYFNDNDYNLCRKFDDCAIVQEYGQQYFDKVTAAVLTPTTYIVAGEQDSTKTADYSLKIFSRDRVKMQGMMVSHKSSVIGLQLIQDSSSVSYNPDSLYLISFSNTELALWDLSRGYAVKNLSFDKYVTTQKSTSLVYYIDEKLLILFNNEVQFAVFFLDRIKIYNNNDVVTLRLVEVKHTKNIKGFVRSGNLLYSYSMDSTLVSYDLSVIYDKGTYSGNVVCTIPGGKIIEKAYAFSTGELVIQLYEEKTYYFYDKKSCTQIDVGHDQYIIQIIIDEAGPDKQKFIFSLQTYKVIFSTVISQASATDPNVNQLSIVAKQNRQIDKSFAFISQNYLLLIDFNGFVLMYSYSSGVLEENYSTNLNWQINFQLSSALVDLNNSNVVLFGKGIILLKFDSTNSQQSSMYQSDITKNIPVQQDKPTDKVNGLIIDTLYNRLIAYSDDGSIRAYERIDVYKNNYRQVIKKYHTDCNILDNNICQNKVMDIQLINPKLFAALYSDGSIILWQYTYTDLQSQKKLMLDDTSQKVQSMNYNNVTGLLVFQSPIQLKVYNTTISQTISVLTVNSTLVNFQYAYTEIYTGNKHCVYVLDTKNKRLNLYLANSTKTVVAASATYSSKKTYTSAKYFSTHRNVVIITDTNISFFSPTLVKTTINQGGISGFVSDGLYQNTIGSVKQILFMRNLQVYSYEGTATLRAQYTSATNVQDYQATYNKVNSKDVFAFYQNSGVSTIQNQVVIINGTSLNFQHILTFQDKISTLTIDPTYQKLYIGFENGQIYSGFFYQDYEIWLSTNATTPIIPVGMYYSSAHKYFFYYKAEIRVLSSVNYAQLTSLKKHTTDLIGFYYSENSKTILSCSTETDTNMFKWDINNISSPSFIQFKNTAALSLSQCFLDDTNNVAIGYYTTNFNIIFWNYTNGNQIFNTTIHQQREAQMQLDQQDLDPAMKISYSIQQMYIDSNIQKLIVNNNLEEIYMHNYATKQDTFIKVSKMIKVYIDYVYKRLLVSVQLDYKQTFYSYNYQTSTIDFYKEFQYHNNPIKGIIFQNDKAYSYEETRIIVMNRNTYDKILTILCVNPIITNFIVFEKLNLVIIWSDFDQGKFNQSIGIYNLLTGSKVADVLGYQSIETGNIHKIIVDEDSYQMIIAKNNPNNYFYTVDLRNFYYTAYYTNRNYTTSVKSMFIMKESNQLVYLDQKEIRVMLIETSINTQNNFLSIIDNKNIDQFYNKDEKKLYYIDAQEVSWQLDTNQKQLLYKSPFSGVRLTYFKNDYFYIVQQNYINKYNKNFVNLGQIDQISVTNTFSNDYLFIFNYNYELYIADLNSFKPFIFYQFDTYIQDVIINENYKEIFVLQKSKKLNRFNFQTKDLLYSFTDANLDFIRIDSTNNVLFQAYINGNLNIYPNYKQDINDYMTAQPVTTLTFGQQIYKIRIDALNNKLYVFLNKVIPLAYVYYYNVTNYVLQTPTLITIFNLPSRSPQMQIQLLTNYLQLTLPWQIVKINRKTLQYIRIDRDNQIFYSQQDITQLAGYDNLYIVQSHNSLAMYYLNQTYTQMFQFNLTYPNLVNYTISNNSNSYYLQLLGISSGIIFQYNFVLPQIGIDSKPLYSINTCYQRMTNIQYGYQVEQQMIVLDQSAKRLKYNLQETLIEIFSQNGFFYHSFMDTYNSNIVYGDNGTQQTIVIRNDTFSKLFQEQIVLSNYNFNIGKNQQVTFPSYNKIITLQNIELSSNSDSVAFIFNGQNNVVLKNIKIDGLSFTGSQTLFVFKDCNQVLIDSFYLKNSIFGGQNYTLFSFTNVKQIEIKNLNILNLTFKEESKVDNIILISNSDLFKFSSSLFQNVNSLSSNKLFIKSYGILKCVMDQINISDVTGISFFNSDNYFTLEDQTVYLYSDQAVLTALQFNEVKNISKSLITFNGNQLNVLNSNFTSINCKTCQGASINVIKTKQFLLQNSNFILNLGNEGGAVSLIDCQYQKLQIIESSFLSCTALAHGGAIYASSSDLMVNKTKIQDCEAEIGGGIRYTELEPIFIYYMQQYELTKLPKYYIANNISNNRAKIYGQNIGSYPKTISIKSKNSLVHEKYNRMLSTEADIYNLDLYSLSNFQSSAEISFEFQILDQELNPIFFDISLFEKNQYPDIISSEITQFNIKSTPGTDDVKIFGQYITDYFQFNQLTQAFAINQMMIIANPSTSNHIYFETPSIKKVLNPTETSRQFSDGPFHIRLNIQFRECVRGEVYKLSGSIFYCQECKEGSYSIVSPVKDEYETQLCLRCPDEASFCYRDQMTLYPGYWKRDNNTDQIVYCTNKPENCEGTEDLGYCIEGHIGPLCENCDVYGKMWAGEYQSDGKFNCIDCTKLRKASYVLPTLFIALGIIVYILISIRIALSISKLIVIGYYLRKLNLLAISKSSYQDTTNMNLKAMMHYMQISSMINTFVIQLPEWMTFIPDYLGSPVENMLYTFDCYLNKASQSKYPIIFLRTAWFLAIPVLYLAVVGVFYGIMVFLRMAKYDKSYIISGLVFLCFFTQPNMVSNLLGVMSCRKIDDKYYIQSDISFECYTKIHLQYIGIVCFPGLFLWGVVIPFFILRTLIKNKNNLDNATIRLKYGFLYQDYKNKHFYWEFVRIYTKLFVIAVLSFYGDPYTNKLVIILILFLIYQVALIKFQPYQMRYFQQIDKTSMVVFIILLIMNIFLYNRPDQVQQQIFYIILIIISNGYQFILLLEVIKAKFSIRFRDTYNKIIQIIFKIFPFMQKFITINKKIPMKTFHYWMKVKFFLNECSERKQYNENSSPQFGRSSELNPEQRFFQPSKRNRNRMFNQNLQLSNSKNNLMSPENMIFSEDISYRNGQQIAKLMKENQPLSVERSDSNYNQLLSPKMFGSFSHMSENKILDHRRDDFILEFDDPASAQQFRKITYGQLLRSLFNYADVEEEEDERRFQKKASVHHEYRLYQRTDLIQKNLKPVQMDDQKVFLPQESINRDETPDINDSVHEINDDKKPKRQAKNLAPRFLMSQDNLDSSTKNETSSKKEPLSDNQNEVQEVSLSSQENLEIQMQQQNRHVYLQQEQRLFAKENDGLNNNNNNNNNNKNENIDLFQDNGNLILSPEDLEEDEDHRRLIKKSQFQHDANIQRKANLIYKNLIYITYDPNQVFEEQNEGSIDLQMQEQKQEVKKDQFCDIENSLLSFDNDDEDKNNFVPKNREFGGIEKINSLNSKTKEDAIQEYELVKVQEGLQSNQGQESLIQVAPKQSPNHFQTQSDISASRQIQDLINTHAQNLMHRGQTLENSIPFNSDATNKHSLINSNELNQFNKSSTLQNQISENPIKKSSPEQNKTGHLIVNDIIEEDENINVDDDEESLQTGKDNLTQNNTKKSKGYFSNNASNQNHNQDVENLQLVNLNDDEDEANQPISYDNLTNKNQDIEQSQKQIDDKFVKKVEFVDPYNTPTKKENLNEDKYSAFDEHNDEKTLFKDNDFQKQLTLTGLGNYFENINKDYRTPTNIDEQIQEHSESEQQQE